MRNDGVLELGDRRSEGKSTGRRVCHPQPGLDCLTGVVCPRKTNEVFVRSGCGPGHLGHLHWGVLQRQLIPRSGPSRWPTFVAASCRRDGIHGAATTRTCSPGASRLGCGCTVSTPRTTYFYAKALGARGKTDPGDAHLPATLLNTTGHCTRGRRHGQPSFECRSCYSVARASPYVEPLYAKP